MGLLDDAIREHLDLKRRRGADPTEIERAEREALGPVRRGPEPAGDEPLGPEADVGADPGYREPEGAIPDPEAALHEEPWEPFEEDPELRAFDDQEELPPYDAPRGPDGDARPGDEQFYGEERGPVPPQPAEFEPAAQAEPAPPPHPADPRPRPG